jgi:hypothetical protein
VPGTVPGDASRAVPAEAPRALPGVGTLFAVHSERDARTTRALQETNMTSETSQASIAQTSAQHLLDEALGFLYAAALRAAAITGVADHLGAGPRTAAELAKLTGTDPEFVERMLRLLVARNLFSEDADCRFQLTPLGTALRSDSLTSVRSAIIMMTAKTQWLPAGRIFDEGVTSFTEIASRLAVQGAVPGWLRAVEAS